ncbi:uroporphyrinogen-III C-methyltransferase [Albirhodobacter sp. R86504]|uniref:uroporphyrinogen-III C-methyltransferase n=1 Tax=Albirhodobacter sp. R86504 TaxID=3093848 RepID=UPI00366F81EC
MAGFVSFVSSGPGDPELLTVKALNRLQAADVVLYDDLSSGPILALVREGAELIAVGKRAGRPSPKQEYVSELLVEHAKKAAKVVRLKSGDCGIYGRLEEEIIALREAGIAFEIIPGVTAATATTAAAGIPLTRRSTSRRVQYVTGHDLTGALPESLNWAALTDGGATTVVYMARRTFPDLATKLMAHGLAPETPALIAEGVSTDAESIRHFTVASLAKYLSETPAPERAPSLIIYGPLMT